MAPRRHVLIPGPILILGLGRLELLDQRPDWPALRLAPLRPEESDRLVESLLAETNSVAIWSEGKLKIIPMDWRPFNAYRPPETAVMLDEDEIHGSGRTDAVTMVRTPDSEVYNHWPVRSHTADDNYAENIYGHPDPELIRHRIFECDRKGLSRRHRRGHAAAAPGGRPATAPARLPGR